MRLYYPAKFEARVKRWGVALTLEARHAPPTDRKGFFLWYDGQRLRLCLNGDTRGIYLRQATVRSRASFDNELARACGVTRKRAPLVMDAMAGLGTDGLVLAGLGASVLLFERQPALWAMLDDYLSADPTPRVRLHLADAREWLASKSSTCCDVLYLDPMFPSRSKVALPAKPMQYLRALTEASSEEPLDLRQWLGAARERVVLKRRRSDPVLLPPDWQIKGTNVRYDVYRAVG